MVRDFCGISYEDSITSNDTNCMTSICKEIRIPNRLECDVNRVYTRHCVWESTDVKRLQDFYRAAATTVETINVDKSVWNYSVW